MNWFKKHGMVYEFHDYKKSGIDAARLKEWCAQTGWETILNKKSTTWRELDAEIQASIKNEKAAVQLMKENTSIIKRPVIEKNNTVIAVGFDEEKYGALFVKKRS